MKLVKLVGAILNQDLDLVDRMLRAARAMRKRYRRDEAELAARRTPHMSPAQIRIRVERYKVGDSTRPAGRLLPHHPADSCEASASQRFYDTDERRVRRSMPEAQIMECVLMYNNGMSLAAIAEGYGVNVATVRRELIAESAQHRQKPGWQY